MWQGHLISRVLSQVSPYYSPPPRRVSTPTPDGFERFLWECVGLARGAGTPSRVRARRRSPVRHDPRGGAHADSHFERGRGVPLVHSQRRALETSRVVEAYSLTQAMW
jgi:hypothetical protein